MSDATLTRNVVRLPAGGGSLAGVRVAADEPEEANGSAPAVAPLAPFAMFVTFGAATTVTCGAGRGSAGFTQPTTSFSP